MKRIWQHDLEIFVTARTVVEKLRDLIANPDRVVQVGVAASATTRANCGMNWNERTEYAA